MRIQSTDESQINRETPAIPQESPLWTKLYYIFDKFTLDKTLPRRGGILFTFFYYTTGKVGFSTVQTVNSGVDR